MSNASAGGASAPQAGGQAAVSDKPAGRDADRYPGRDLGLPETGPGSVASVGRRLGALVIDWLACTLISLAIFRTQAWTIVFFAAETWVLTSLTGLTLGKRLVGIRVARLGARPVGLLAGALRTVLLLLVVPPLVFDKDLRGLHDKAAQTVVLRM
ncbi:MAG TPA: RDD family protein [Streptosporangiaceae bacterium]|nr:RDD family protein [Streptosporangiaceae bacterium]